MHKSKINFCLENKVALVTGAGHGIGAGCARQLSLAGAIVALNDHPDSKDIDTTAKVISRESGQRTTVIRADYFDESERINLLNNTLSAFDHIDILICNPYKSIQKPSINWSLVEFREIFEAVFISPGVSVAPGAIELTRIPYSIHSKARILVNFRSAALPQS